MRDGESHMISSEVGGFFDAADDGRMVAGLDEVGRGPLAGPVVAAAVILHEPMTGLADSKTLSPKRRETLASALHRSDRVFIGLGAASVGEIDDVNILGATMLAMQRALARLGITPDLALVDGNRLPDLPCPAEAVVGGDGLVPAIAAASIVAKVTRDRLMTKLDRRHPGYGWAKNAGYPTAEHRVGPGAAWSLSAPPHELWPGEGAFGLGRHRPAPPPDPPIAMVLSWVVGRGCGPVPNSNDLVAAAGIQFCLG